MRILYDMIQVGGSIVELPAGVLGVVVKTGNPIPLQGIALFNLVPISLLWRVGADHATYVFHYAGRPYWRLGRFMPSVVQTPDLPQKAIEEVSRVHRGVIEAYQKTEIEIPGWLHRQLDDQV